MSPRIRHIATRFALILALAAILPLLGYGGFSIWSLQRGTRESVVAGNQNVAARAAEEIRRYISSHAEILRSLAAEIQDTGLDQRQLQNVVTSHVLQFSEFREITLFDASNRVIVSSRIGPPRVTVPKDPGAIFDGVSMSPIRVDEDLLPTAVFRSSSPA